MSLFEYNYRLVLQYILEPAFLAV